MKKQFFLGLILGICLSLVIFNPILAVRITSSSVQQNAFNNQLSLKLPHSTRALEPTLFENGQLRQSIYFDDQTLLIRGYLQLWNLEDLEEYLINSKRLSTFDFHSYALKPINVAQFNGYLTEWTASFGANYQISGMEYWLKRSETGEVLRLSFFTDSSSFSKEQLAAINDILQSIQWKD